MFVLVVLQDLIRTIPEEFDRDPSVVTIEQIELKYVNKILPGAGLGISFYDFVSLGDPYVYPAEGKNPGSPIHNLLMSIACIIPRAMR